MKNKSNQTNLLNNSIAAYFAAIEIHNKPSISYRYETVTLLIINAWELLLKSFILKYIKNRSIFENDSHTISFDKSLTYCNDYLNTKKSNSFLHIKLNLEIIEVYRNDIIHFYNEKLEPYIFMLVAKASINYIDFINDYFEIDIIKQEGLYILPLGFKLPFKPEEFLAPKTIKNLNIAETNSFIESIIKSIKQLDDQGIKDTVVVGFDVYLESIKKLENSDLQVAITDIDNADLSLSKVTKYKPVDDPDAMKVYLSDAEILENYPLTHQDVCNKCRSEIKAFKQNKIFYEIMKSIKSDKTLCFERKLNPKYEKSSTTIFYSNRVISKIKGEFESINKKY